MLLCTLSWRHTLHPEHGFVLGYAQMSEAQISCAGTKASSLSETGDHQGSIWQPVLWASRVDDLEMKNANNASLLQVLLAGVGKLDTFLPQCFPSLSLSLFPSFILPASPWLCHSLSLPATLSSPILSFVRHPHR